MNEQVTDKANYSVPKVLRGWPTDLLTAAAVAPCYWKKPNSLPS